MRPVKKWPVGHTLLNGNNIETDYDPHGLANPILELNLDPFCSYCEVFSSDLEVEHIVSQNQDATLVTKWDNFLRSCGRCNGRDNKSNKHVDLNLMYFPHQNNTLLVFEYREGGLVALHPGLGNNEQKDKARALLKLVGLDKYPGNSDYPPNQRHLQGFPVNDNRWEHRRQAWEWAQSKLKEYEANKISAVDVANYADRRGFFSVWFSVFSAYKEVKEALFNAFVGTDLDCFDMDFNPIPRNPTNIDDPI